MLGDNLRNERLKAGLNQVELAKIFNVSKQTVSNWESGNRIPGLKTTEQLAIKQIVKISSQLNINAYELAAWFIAKELRYRGNRHER